MRSVCLALGAALIFGVPGSGAAGENPITPISSKMTTVAGDLAKTKTGEPVQTQQKEIVKDLDELIAMLEKQCAACKGGVKKNNPTKPLADSVIRSGTGGIGSLVDPRQSSKDWAKISDRERDRILQSMSEGFPPEYRLVLERYYRRLAEEKNAQSGAAPTEPKAPATQADQP